MQDVVALQRRVWDLQEENRHLRELIAPRLEFPSEWRLAKSMAVILSTLYTRRGPVHSDLLRAALYGFGQEREDITLTVLVLRLRRRLAETAPQVVVLNHHGVGYYLPEESRAVIAEALAR